MCYAFNKTRNGRGCLRDCWSNKNKVFVYKKKALERKKIGAGASHFNNINAMFV